MIRRHPGGFFDGNNPNTRRKVLLHKFNLVDEDGVEVPVYNSDGLRVARRTIEVDPDEPPCGVLLDLARIQNLFNPDMSDVDYDNLVHSSQGQDDPHVRIEAYPLAFLKTVGNIKATGIPHSFYPFLADINRSVRSDPAADPTSTNDADGLLEREEGPPHLRSTYQPVKPVSSQFYNYISHRVASRAGRLDAQQGSVTAAISGAFALSSKDEKTAREKQIYCLDALPSDRFKGRIDSVDDCPTSCRAELVYSVDVRALSNPSGS